MSLFLGSVAPAVASDSTSQGYKATGPRVLGQVEGNGDSGGGQPEQKSGVPASNSGSPQTADSGTLPFTGFEASLVLGVGLGLAGVGFAMRRVARDPA